MSFDLRSVGPGLLLVTAVLLLLAFVCFCAMLGLRFARRGEARFWTGPAMTALALLPGAVGTAFAAHAFSQVLEGTALTGSGGVAALAAGSAESFLPLLAGLASMLVLSFCGLMLFTNGSRVRDGGAARGGAGVLICLPAVFAVFGIMGLLIWIIWDVNGGADPVNPGELLLRMRLAFFGSLGLSIFLAVLAAGSILGAPRGNAPFLVKVVPFLSLAIAGTGAVPGLVLSFVCIDGLMRTAMTGVPAGERRTIDGDTAGPPDTVPGDPQVEVPPRQEDVGLGVEGGLPEGPVAEAVRVGGTIKEPKKLKSVAPVYPDIAKQARVQGVVILECTISPRGDVTDVKLLRGAPLLDVAAIEAVRQWVYAPTVLNGVPVPVIMTVTVNFKLD